MKTLIYPISKGVYMEQRKRTKKWFLGLTFLISVILLTFNPLLAKQPEGAALDVLQQASFSDVPLAAGWNLVSLPNAPTDSDPAAVFAPISSEHSVTYGYDGCAVGEQWQVYDPADSSGTNDLTAIDHAIGFWIETTADTILPTTGTQPPTTTIQLCAGWNLIGLPLAQARPVRSALASIEGKYTQVFGFNPADPLDPWQGYDATAPSWSNTLEQMEPRRGYWVYATEDTPFLAANEGPAPIVDITAPAATSGDLPIITTFTEVFGVINSNLLDSWTLAYRPIESEEWVTLATGNTPLYDELMGTFDPTLLANGMYELQLTAVDFQGQSSIDTETIVVDGEFKVGDFSISFVDLNVPVAGIPLSLVRTYDSRDKSVGDFGAGWTLDIYSSSFRHNRTPGDGWFIEGQGVNLCDSYNETKPHITEIRFSDVEYYLFKPTLVLQGATTGGCNGFVAYEQVGGLPGASLEISDGADIFWYFGSDELLDFSFDGSDEEVFEPKEVTLTTLDGREFKFSLDSGLYEVRDTYDNTLTITDDDITHSSGKSISFERDPEGRITQITDPMGNAINYEYDANGDLIYHTDQEDYTTEFIYDDNHYLTDIIDARGVTAQRIEYDEDGRMIALGDADGNSIQFIHNLDENQEIVIDKRGNLAHFAYDDQGNVLTETRSVTIEGQVVPVVTTYEYDEQGRQTAVVDPDGNRFEAAYNDNDMPTEVVVDPDGLNLVTGMSYNNLGRMESLTYPNGSTINATFDSNGAVASFTNPLSQTHALAPNPQGLMASHTDPLGTVSSGTYNSNGYQTSREVRDDQDNLISRETFTYDGNGNPLTNTVYRTISGTLTPLTTYYAYDALNHVTAVTDTLGNVSHFTYNEIGLITSKTDSLGNTTSYTYSNLGLLDTINYPDGTSESRDYDESGNLIAVTDQADQTTTFIYDELNRPIQTIYTDGYAQETVYSPGGQIVAEIDRLGNRTGYTYDAAGRITLITLPPIYDIVQGSLVTPTVQKEYDDNGNVKAVISPDNLRTEFVYDGNNQIAKVILPDFNEQERYYDALGRLIEVIDEENRSATYEYDGGGRLAKVTLPAPAPGEPNYEMSYAYDELGNMISQTDANGHTTNYMYDELSRLIQTIRPGGQTETYTYDNMGNLITVTDANDNTTTFSYDEMGRLIQKSFPDNTSELFTYTDAGLLETVTNSQGTTNYTYNDLHQLTQLDLAAGQSISYTYDLNGNLTSINAPNGSTSYAYNALNMIQQVTMPGGTAAYGYDIAGNFRQTTSVDGIITDYTYNSRSQLTNVNHHTVGNVTLASFAYDLSPTGRRMKVTESDGSIVDFAYDGLDRLRSEIRVGTDPYSISYEYDAVGNRTRMVASGEETLYAYNDNDQMLTAGDLVFTYDDNGNTTSQSDGINALTYGYDYENQLTSVTNGGTTINYEYDVFGNLVKQELAGDITQYLVDQRNPTGYAQVLEESDGSGNLLASYNYGYDLLNMSENSTDYSYLYDGQMSTRLLTSGGSVTDAYNYDAFGGLVSATGASGNPYLYGGERFDAQSGAYYLRARFYNQDTGRFLTRDAFAGFENDPLSRHNYLFNHDNPVNRVDPSGHMSLIELNIANLVTGILKATGATVTYGKVCTIVEGVQLLPYYSLIQGIKNFQSTIAENPFLAGLFSNGFNLNSLNTTGYTFLKGKVWEHPMASLAGRFPNTVDFFGSLPKEITFSGSFDPIKPEAKIGLGVSSFKGASASLTLGFGPQGLFFNVTGGTTILTLEKKACGLVSFAKLAFGVEAAVGGAYGSGGYAHSHGVNVTGSFTLLGLFNTKSTIWSWKNDGKGPQWFPSG